jgi:hypothetical protein
VPASLRPKIADFHSASERRTTTFWKDRHSENGLVPKPTGSESAKSNIGSLAIPRRVWQSGPRRARAI